MKKGSLSVKTYIDVAVVRNTNRMLILKFRAATLTYIKENLSSMEAYSEIGDTASRFSSRDTAFVETDSLDTGMDAPEQGKAAPGA